MSLAATRDVGDVQYAVCPTNEHIPVTRIARQMMLLWKDHTIYDEAVGSSKRVRRRD